MNWNRCIAVLAAGLALMPCVTGCMTKTFSHPIGYHYVEFQGRYSAPELAESIRATLGCRATSVSVQFLQPREEDPRFYTTYVRYSTERDGKTYHHMLHIDCMSLCLFKGSIECARQRCSVSAAANEQTLGAAYVKALLAELEQTLVLPTDFRGPPRQPVERRD